MHGRSISPNLVVEGELFSTTRDMLQTLKYILIHGTTKRVSMECTERLFTNLHLLVISSLARMQNADIPTSLNINSISIYMYIMHVVLY